MMWGNHFYVVTFFCSQCILRKGLHPSGVELSDFTSYNYDFHFQFYKQLPIGLNEIAVKRPIETTVYMKLLTQTRLRNISSTVIKFL
jgi:hypothetical protein